MTPEEQLQYETHQARIHALRSSASGPPYLQTWLNSSVVAALIGVIGTGIVGAVVSGRIQERARNNELAVTTEKEVRAARAEIVGKILDVVSRNLAATDDLLVTVHSSYAADRIPEQEREKLAEWKRGLAERRDKSDAEWREVRRSLGYALLYRFNGDPEFSAKWDTVVTRSDAFEQCTNQWYSANARVGSDTAVADVCRAERQGYEGAVGELTTLAATR